MFSVEWFENLFFTLAMIFLALYGLASLAETKPSWFLSKTFLKAKKMEEAYDRSLQSRKDMMVHSPILSTTTTGIRPTTARPK